MTDSLPLLGRRELLGPYDVFTFFRALELLSLPDRHLAHVSILRPHDLLPAYFDFRVPFLWDLNVLSGHAALPDYSVIVERGSKARVYYGRSLEASRNLKTFPLARWLYGTRFMVPIGTLWFTGTPYQDLPLTVHLAHRREVHSPLLDRTAWKRGAPAVEQFNPLLQMTPVTPVDPLPAWWGDGA